MRIAAVIIVLLVLFQSCNDSDHLGYKRLEGSLHYKRITLGDAEVSVTGTASAYVSFSVSYLNDSGGVIATKTVDRIPVASLQDQGNGISKALTIMDNNDSALFVGTETEVELSKAFPGLDIPETSEVHFSLRVNDVLTDLGYRAWLANERAKGDPEMHEMAGLQAVLDSLGLVDSDNLNGMYYKSILDGGGAKPASGEMIWVNYIGRFASGEEFDNTYKGKRALEYQVGKPDQVIKGFGQGIAQMRQGGRAIFVIPSPVGFGEDGSSSGVVPPYTTLIYEVHLLRVGV